MCPFAMTRTASCLRAYGTERDYVVSYSLCCTIVWCVRGLSCSTVSWAHLGNVTGVKSGELGAYYVTLFLQFGNRRLLARPGLCRTVQRGHNNSGLVPPETNNLCSYPLGCLSAQWGINPIRPRTHLLVPNATPIEGKGNYGSHLN